MINFAGVTTFITPQSHEAGGCDRCVQLHGTLFIEASAGERPFRGESFESFHTHCIIRPQQ